MISNHLKLTSLVIFFGFNGFSQTNLFPSSGNVGIGTTNPNAKLKIVQSGTIGGFWAPTKSFLTISDTGTSSLIMDSNEIYGSGTLHLGTRSGDIIKFRAVTETATSDRVVIKSDGKVGIGTMAPSALLEVRSSNNLKTILNRNDQSAISFLPNNGNSIFHIAHGLNNDLNISHGTTVGGGNIMTIKNNGNIGIGTLSPTAKLQVQGTIKGQKLLLLDPNDTDNWNNLWESGFYQSYNATNAPEPNQWFWGINMNHSSNNSQYRYNGQIVIKNNSVHPRMYFRSTKVDGTGIWTRVVHSEGTQHINGSLGIGTTNPNGWKLAVNGKIRAKEIKVETNWADYVFEDEYNLPTLQEVEKHIQEKGHLKNIPSAKEVEKNGVELGEMNKLLLEKIEELTLYTIAQEKRIQALEKKLENQ